MSNQLSLFRMPFCFSIKGKSIKCNKSVILGHVYAVLALLTTLGKGSSKHSDVISLFDEYFVKTGKLSVSLRKALHRAFGIRQIGDYRELYQLEHEQSEEVLRSVEQFLEEVEKHLASR